MSSSTSPVLPTQGLTRAEFKLWLILPVTIFVLSRIASALLVTYLHDGVAVDGSPFAQNFFNRWDAQWFQSISESGYPSGLPRDRNGDVLQSELAFYPLFPAIAAIFMTLGLSFTAAGVLVSCLFGAGAMVLLYRLLAPTTGVFTATLTITSLSFSPTSLAFGVPYTESMALFLILLCFIFLHSRRPAAFLLTALALSLTRPVVPAVAAVVGVVWLVRWFQRKKEPFPLVERVTWAAVAATTAALFLLWPLAVAWRTGELDGYAQTQAAWQPTDAPWHSWISYIFTLTPTGALVAALLLALVVIAWRMASSWPMTLRAWTVLYPFFILGASRMTPSIFRYLALTAAPAWPFPDLTRNLQRRTQILLIVSTVLVGCTLQWVWIDTLWLSVAYTHP